LATGARSTGISSAGGALGLIIAVVVTDASTEGRQGLVDLLTQYFADGVKRLRKIWVDGAYPAEWREEWVRGLKQTHKIDLEATTHKEGKGFQVVPWRWAVERTFAWLLNDRRHSRDYERLTVNSAAMIQIIGFQIKIREAVMPPCPLARAFHSSAP
jgi:transposase